MPNEKGNFRLPYYEKCGFRNEEKKSLEIILKDKPLDKQKLQKFCVSSTIPLAYRNFVWKILLGVVPVFIDSHEFIMEQRTTEYKELVRALQTLRVIDTSSSKMQMFYAVWLLQTGNLGYYAPMPKENEPFILLAQAFLQHFDNDVESYWTTKLFYEYINKYKNDYPKLFDRFWKLLEREDIELFTYLESTKLNKEIPLQRWFDCCFAGVLNDNALAKIWDKICGGSVKILVFVTVALLTMQRNEIMKCTNIQMIMECFKNIPENVAELIACKSIEMWQKHGSPKNNISDCNNS